MLRGIYYVHLNAKDYVKQDPRDSLQYELTDFMQIL